MFATQEEALKALHSTISELEALTKSWDPKKSESEDKMQKAEGDMPPPDDAAGAEGGDAAPAPEAAPEAHGEPDGDEGVPAPDAGAEGGDMPPEAGAEGGEGDMMEQVAAEASQLSDDELDMMLHALMSEKDNRMQAEGGEGAPAPDAGAAPEAAPAPEAGMEEEQKSLAMSMKEEFKKMAKSFNDQVSKLQKSVDSLKVENEKLRKQAARPTTKPAAANKVEVLEKSVKEPEMLSKSETSEYLLGQMRAKNRSVTSEHVALVNACRTIDDLKDVYGRLRGAGIEIPSKK